jgi:antitoxin component of MazEF toxin-antitoxin module
MKEKFIKILRKSGTSLAVNIPVEVTKLLDMKEGDLVRVEIEKIKK